MQEQNNHNVFSFVNLIKNVTNTFKSLMFQTDIPKKDLKHKEPTLNRKENNKKKK